MEHGRYYYYILYYYPMVVLPRIPLYTHWIASWKTFWGRPSI